MFSTEGLILLSIFGLSIYYSFFRKRKYNHPPGPWGFPLVGTIFSLGDKPYITFQKWAKQYGPLVKTKFALNDVIILNDGKLIREALKDPVFNGRATCTVFELLSDGKHGITNASGEEWTEQRRFTMKALRDFGFGKRSMESLIVNEVNDFLKWIKDREGQPSTETELDERFMLASINALWTIMTGEHYEQDDPAITKILATVTEKNMAFNSIAPANGLAFYLPELLDYIPKIFMPQWDKAMATYEKYKKIFKDPVGKRMKMGPDESEPRDFMDAYLKEIKKTSDPKSSFYKERGVKTLEIVMGDLYDAARGTTSTMLTWAVFYLAKFPEIQHKLQQELDSVVGKNRQPSLADKAELKYAEALTTEIFRHSSIAPLSLFHEAMDDATLNGYDVRKGTMVITNLYAVHHSVETWGDPENFRPERFLSPDGKNVLRSENVMAFGTGKRVCAGEGLGRDSFFLFLTSLFQRFEVSSDPNHPLPSLDAAPGFFRETQPYKLIFKERIQ